MFYMFGANAAAVLYDVYRDGFYSSQIIVLRKLDLWLQTVRKEEKCARLFSFCLRMGGGQGEKPLPFYNVDVALAKFRRLISGINTAL